jgi:hypothetical protein
MAQVGRKRIFLPLVVAAAVGFVCACQWSAAAAPKKSEAAKPAAEQEDEGAAKAAAKKKMDAAEAQRLLDGAFKQLEAGHGAQAMPALTSVVTAGKLPPAIMAKGLLYRGMAYRQQKKPAQAIADLTGALWLKGGLSEADRADALRQRSAAYQEAGLTEGGETQTAAVPRETPKKERTASASPGWGASTTAALASTPDGGSQPAVQSSGGWNLLNNLFGGFGASSSSTAANTPATTASIEKPQPAATGPSRPKVGNAWSSHTEVREDPAAAPTRSAAASHAPSGRYRVQIATVRTQAEAKVLAERVKREHGTLLASRVPDIDQAVVGNMGSFYRVRVGPFASESESQGVCAKLKSTGLDCLVVTQ